jgi:hypothetical protein
MKRTLKDMGNQLAHSLQKLNPAQREQTRKAMYESVTGKPYRAGRLGSCITITAKESENG